MFLPSTPCFTETVKENVPAMEVRSLTTESKGSCHRGEFIVAVGGTLDARIVTGSLDFALLLRRPHGRESKIRP